MKRWNTTFKQSVLLIGLSALLLLPGSASAEATPGALPRPTDIRMVNQSLSPGMTGLIAVVGQSTDRPLAVRVTENGVPAAHRRITFRITVLPTGAKGAVLSINEARTDGRGRAEVAFRVGNRPGMYVVSAYYEDGFQTPPVHFSIEARPTGWFLFVIFGLLGGLGLFLLGMEISGEGLKNAAGHRMKTILSRFTGNRFSALLTGVLATVVLQSSSATTVMLVGFVDATAMTLAQAIGVTLGAKIGTTVTAQLIAFNVADYALLAVAAGVLMRVSSRRHSLRHAADALLGFGLLFFGLSVMSRAVEPLRTLPLFIDALAHLGHQPVLGILIAAGFTALVQSSAITIGLAIALCAGGVLTLEAGLPLAWGAHLGTCATALLASLGTGRAGKQVAVAHLLVAATGVLIAFPFLFLFVDGARALTGIGGSDSVARQVANGHTIFTVTTGLVLIGLIRPFAWLTRRLVPLRPGDEAFAPRYLNPASLEVPAVAIDLARRETLRLAGIVRGMLNDAMGMLATPDADAMDRMEREDDKVDILEKAIRPYLARMARGHLESSLRAVERTLIYVVEELEGIGDILTKEIAHTARKLHRKEISFSQEGVAELRAYHARVAEKFALAEQAMGRMDGNVAAAILARIEGDHALERELRERHLERLHSMKEASVATSTWHLSTLSNLRAIGERIDNIARTLIEELSPSDMTHLHHRRHTDRPHKKNQ